MKTFSLLLAIAFAGVSCTDHNINAVDVQQEGDAIKKLVTVTYRDALAGYFGEVDHLIPWQIDHLINWRPKAKNAVEAGSKLVNKKCFYW